MTPRRYALEQLAVAIGLSVVGLAVAAYRILRGCHGDCCNTP